MNTSGLHLLIPEKADPERDAVAAAFEAAGGSVIRLGRFWDPPQLSASSVRVYGNETFCLVLQEKLGLTLQSPADDLMTNVDSAFLHRRLGKARLGDTLGGTFPLFVKSLVPKQFPSRVYVSATDLTQAAAGLDLSAQLIVSEPVRFLAEARAFVLGSEALDVALYEGDAPLAGARAFLHRLLDAVPLIQPVVVDVGLLSSGTWVLVEFNAAWGAGLNGCSASRVLPAIAAASGPGILATEPNAGRTIPPG